MSKNYALQTRPFHKEKNAHHVNANLFAHISEQTNRVYSPFYDTKEPWASMNTASTTV